MPFVRRFQINATPVLNFVSLNILAIASQPDFNPVYRGSRSDGRQPKTIDYKQCSTFSIN